jgi:hypothetical protein
MLRLGDHFRRFHTDRLRAARTSAWAYIAVLIHPFEEWQQARADKQRLGRIGVDHAAGRQWDVAKGQWMDRDCRRNEK